MRHRRKGTRRRSEGGAAGFTLLEVILAMVVVSLAMAVTYPALSRGSASLDLRAAGRDMLNTLRYAREKAITEGAGSRVVINREAGTITLTDAYGDPMRQGGLRSGVRIARLAVGGEEILEGPLVVRFLPNGSTDSAEIVLISKTNALLSIVTDPITGGARIVTEAGRAAERRRL